MKYDTIIFDKDGVLLDSAIDDFLWMDKIRVKAAKQQGYDFDVEDSRKVVHAGSSAEIGGFIEEKGMSWKDLEEIEEKVQRRKIKLIENGDIRLFPQAEKILSSIELPKAMVTNAPWGTAEFTVEYFDIRTHFKEIRAPDLSPLENYYDRKKPHPEMIKQVVEQIGAENPVMVGDTATDIKAAENAGIDSIQVTAYGNNRVDGADHVIGELDELKMYT